MTSKPYMERVTHRCGDGWLQIDLVYSGSVTVPVDQDLKGLPHQLQVSKTPD